MSKHIASQFNSPYDSHGFLLWRVSSAWQRNIRDALETLGLTHAQFVLLANLGSLETSGIVTQVKLAERIGADVMTTSSLVRAMEQKGYLTREKQTLDTRANSLKLTTDGLKLVRQAIPLVEKADGLFFATLEQPQTFKLELQQLIGVK
jgi:DNA-binding MarR family transcriptional regulator